MAVVIAIHEIDNVAGFWSTVRRSVVPSRTARLDAVYPLVNGAKAVSIWDGISADVVGDLVEVWLGDFGRNEFYEVDREHGAHLSRLGGSTREEDRR